jgi:hypothetical protein
MANEIKITGFEVVESSVHDVQQHHAYGKDVFNAEIDLNTTTQSVDISDTNARIFRILNTGSSLVWVRLQDGTSHNSAEGIAIPSNTHVDLNRLQNESHIVATQEQ